MASSGLAFAPAMLLHSSDAAVLKRTLWYGNLAIYRNEMNIQRHKIHKQYVGISLGSPQDVLNLGAPVQLCTSWELMKHIVATTTGSRSGPQHREDQATAPPCVHAIGS
ncbi:hypothetical protein BJ875DRAFT_142155 [Amylocarpus encephaloides]|uniref:Uncharacterized protein n=1 Tax=Amylocarpus encephaloides TaxID=45428 RepID=A0A9P8C8N4_9HELO|nr:hypothetical protein BJ875DRAFT_142155 [Amylocarpus encephaloides]